MDTSQIIEIEQSPTRMILLLGLGLVMTTLSAAFALSLVPGIVPGGFAQIVGLVGLLFFGTCTHVIFWRLRHQTGPVVTLSPDGIRDKRIAAEVIPWSAIVSVGTWSMSGQNIMVLAVDPEIENKLALTRVARWTRGPNRILGADGPCVSVQGLKISYEVLMSLTQSHLQDHGGHS